MHFNEHLVQCNHLALTLHAKNECSISFPATLKRKADASLYLH